MTDDGEAVDAPTRDDARPDPGQPAPDVPSRLMWDEALLAELGKRVRAPVSARTIMRDLQAPAPRR